MVEVACSAKLLSWLRVQIRKERWNFKAVGDLSSVRPVGTRSLGRHCRRWCAVVLVVARTMPGGEAEAATSGEHWVVIKAIDPMTDKPMCRITGKPEVKYVMRAGRWLFHIAPFVEAYGGDVYAGFTSAYADLGSAPPTALFSTVEYRFGSSQAVTISGARNHTLILPKDEARAFIQALLANERLRYRADGSGVVEFSLSGLQQKLAECAVAP